MSLCGVFKGYLSSHVAVVGHDSMFIVLPIRLFDARVFIPSRCRSPILLVYELILCPILELDNLFWV